MAAADQSVLMCVCMAYIAMRPKKCETQPDAASRQAELATRTIIQQPL